MSTYNSEPQVAERGVTLNDLKERRCTLNMQLRFAIANHDIEGQEKLEQAVQEADEEIERMVSGCGMASKPRSWI